MASLCYDRVEYLDSIMMAVSEDMRNKLWEDILATQKDNAKKLFGDLGIVQTLEERISASNPYILRNEIDAGTIPYMVR